MAYILAYTRKGEGIYPQDNYPGHIAYLCDLEHAMHLAFSTDGTHFTALRNNTGILFPKCSFDEGRPQGTTKTLIDPWLVRCPDHSFLVLSVRRNQNTPDSLSLGCLMYFTSSDLVRYKEAGFLKLSDKEIRHPKGQWNKEKQAYYLEWESDEGRFCGYTRYFKEVWDVRSCETSVFTSDVSEYGIDGCVPGNVLEISDEELCVIRSYLDVIRHVDVSPLSLSISSQNNPAVLKYEDLPKANCIYSDGSTHEKKVIWSREDFDRIDFSKPGDYPIRGEIFQKKWPYPFPLSGGGRKTFASDVPDNLPDGFMSDPCITYYHGKYYLTSTSGQNIVIRAADTIEGISKANPQVIYTIPLDPGVEHVNAWASELHIIHGIPYLLNGICPDSWVNVKSHIMRCNGELEDPNAWEAPRLVVKPNGRVLTEGGISLDMTYFCINGVHYVMWSDRKIDCSTTPEIPSPADIYIATVDPDAPWQLTTEPQCILRPYYGWDRCETEVDEGPYLLRRGDDLFITISGSSTGMSDLYCVGLLHAKITNNLLTADGWDWLPYPILTKESAKNQYGPGHNNFVVDKETGDTMMVYHTVPHKDGKSLNRHPAIRRVHWAKNGYPYLEMTEERDLNPDLKNVVLTVHVHN